VANAIARRHNGEEAPVDQRSPDADYVAGPDDPERARRLAWAELLRRVFAEDVLRCRRCGGEMRLIAVIENPAVSTKILKHLGLWNRGPPRPRHVVVAPADSEPTYDEVA
jgi:hypothetical protein